MCRSATLTSTHLAFNSKIKEGLALYMQPGWAHNGLSAGSAAFVAVSAHPTARDRRFSAAACDRRCSMGALRDDFLSGHGR